MKLFAFFFALIIGSAICSPGQSLTRIGGGGGGYPDIPLVRYPVKGIEPDSTKFRAIFADVSKVANLERQRKSLVTIAQTFSAGVFMAEIHPSKTVVLELPGKAYADDTQLHLSVENTGKLYSYTTVTGSNATLAIYRLVNPQQKFTPEMFVSALKRGESYTVRRVNGTEKKDLLVVWE